MNLPLFLQILTREHSPFFFLSLFPLTFIGASVLFLFFRINNTPENSIFLFLLFCCLRFRIIKRKKATQVMSGLYNPNFSPARAASPQIRTSGDADSQYLSELLAEHQKLGPFMQILPICSRLLNQEILRVSGMMSNQGFSEFERLRHRSPSPMASSNLVSNISGTGFGSWNGLPQEPRLSGNPGMTMDWQGAPASPSSFTVKRILRLEIPVDTYPNFNFVGRLLGPRGNSLKRVEATTGCRVYIRGKGSIKDPEKDEPNDYIKRQQLRELAMLNSNFREESPGPSGSVSPFNSSGMKRAKTGR